MKRVQPRASASRRSFLQKAVAGAGATAAAVLGAGAAGAQEGSQNAAAANVPPIRIPAEFSAAQAAAPVTFTFPMTGAQVFARACKEEGVAALFACGMIGKVEPGVMSYYH